MNIKQYEGETLRACLEQVRADLGPEAVIIETRKLKKGGVLGMGSKDTVRIIAAAAVGTEAASQNAGAQPAATRAVVHRPGPARRQAAPTATPTEQARIFPPDSNSPSGGATTDLARLAAEVQELRRSLRQMQSSPAERNEWTRSAAEKGSAGAARQILLDADVDPNLVEEIVAGVPDFDSLSDAQRTPALLSFLGGRAAARIPVAGPIQITPSQQTRVALIGPTGVGKTTTIAKLAAHYALTERRKVGLLTLDTYRIAAIEQLRTYAQLLALPLRVVYSPDEAPAALAELEDRELILVDTAGRSQKHAMQMQELRALIQAVRCETHLVLSATTKRHDLHHQIARFSEAGVDRLLFTKLDETASLGALFSVAATAEVPLSYLTMGQKVPEDIEVAEAGKIVAMTLAPDRC